MSGVIDTVAGEIARHGGWAMGVVVFGFFFGGFVKGAVGFGLPTVGIAVAATVLPGQTAIGYLAIPLVLSNVWQSLRTGLGAALETLRDYALFIGVMLVVLFASTRLLPVLGDRGFFAVIGVGMLLFSGAQLAGWQPPRPPRPAGDIAAGSVAGFFGGLSGIWGPPVIMFLMALDVPKTAMVRACGVIFLLGSFPFMAGHVSTGVLNAATATVSVLLILPALVGMGLGQAVQDRLDAGTFRRAMQIVFLIAGANFLRRAIFG